MVWIEWKFPDFLSYSRLLPTSCANLAQSFTSLYTRNPPHSQKHYLNPFPLVNEIAHWVSDNRELHVHTCTPVSLIMVLDVYPCKEKNNNINSSSKNLSQQQLNSHAIVRRAVGGPTWAQPMTAFAGFLFFSLSSEAYASLPIAMIDTRPIHLFIRSCHTMQRASSLNFRLLINQIKHYFRWFTWQKQ